MLTVFVVDFSFHVVGSDHDDEGGKWWEAIESKVRLGKEKGA